LNRKKIGERRFVVVALFGAVALNVYADRVSTQSALVAGLFWWAE
jgi:hypothetical protein